MGRSIRPKSLVAKHCRKFVGINWMGLLFLTIVACMLSNNSRAAQTCQTLLDTSMQAINGSKSKINLCNAYRGKVLLIVNTASRCGYTNQLEGLEQLHRKYADSGLVVLGFPSDDFQQEPGSNEEISTFCKLNYGVSFPLFEKSQVSGPNPNAVYKELITQVGKKPQWNFFKYLVNREGKAVATFNSNITPSDSNFIRQLEKVLSTK